MLITFVLGIFPHHEVISKKMILTHWNEVQLWAETLFFIAQQSSPNLIFPIWTSSTIPHSRLNEHTFDKIINTFYIAHRGLDLGTPSCLRATDLDK